MRSVSARQALAPITLKAASKAPPWQSRDWPGPLACVAWADAPRHAVHGEGLALRRQGRHLIAAAVQRRARPELAEAAISTSVVWLAETRAAVSDETHTTALQIAFGRVQYPPHKL